MLIFSLANLYMVSVFSSLIICRFLIRSSSSKNKAIYYAVYCAVDLIFILANAHLGIPDFIGNYIGLVVAFCFCLFMLKTTFSTALLLSVLTTTIFGIFNTSAFAITGILLRETPISEYVIIGLNSVFILISSAVTLELILKRYARNKDLSIKYSILYICPLAFIYFVTDIIVNMAYGVVTAVDERVSYGGSTEQDVEILFIIAVSVISIFVILHFHEKAISQIDAQNKMVAMEAYADIQRQYISEAKQKYESTRSFRHDTQNHFNTIAGLIKNDNGEKALEYLERFGAQAAELTFEVVTGNAVIDVLLKEKLSFARELGIAVKCDATIPRDIAIDDFDLCIIMFNALDNAIKGCKHAGDKFIDLAVKPNKNFFIIDIVNGYDKSNYDKGLGIGLETIRFIAEKYGGYCETVAEDTTFRVSVMFQLK